MQRDHTNRQKCDYYLDRIEGKGERLSDPRYAADGQRDLFKARDLVVPEILVAGIDPGPSKHGLAVRGPAVRSFRAPVLFAGECEADELVGRLSMAGEALVAIIFEWAATNPHIVIKNRYLDDTIGAQHVLREKLRPLGVPIYCAPRQQIILQLGVPAFCKGNKDKLLRLELLRQGYDDPSICNTHTRAALAAALLNYRHPDNARYLTP